MDELQEQYEKKERRLCPCLPLQLFLVLTLVPGLFQFPNFARHMGLCV